MKGQFVTESGLDVEKILKKFVEHFTESFGNSTDAFVEENGRKLFMLYIRPLINGIGNYYIEARTRSMGRTDLIIDYLGKQYIIEMKIWHGNEYNTRGEEQLLGYLNDYHLERGYMLSFKKKGQSHYCGEKPKTIDEYILSQDEDKQEDLRYIRRILRSALPEAEERISWSMPTYWKGHNIVHFAASKKHIGLYPGPAAVEEFAEALKGYKTDKGTIRIPYGKVDEELIKKIALWCYETGNY